MAKKKEQFAIIDDFTGDLLDDVYVSEVGACTAAEYMLEDSEDDVTVTVVRLTPVVRIKRTTGFTKEKP